MGHLLYIYTPELVAAHSLSVPIPTYLQLSPHHPLLGYDQISLHLSRSGALLYIRLMG